MATEEQPKITLHWLEESRAQRIVWLLDELEVPYETVIYRRGKPVPLAPKELQEVHTLGKSPVLTVLPPGAAPDAKPIVLAESGFMTEWLCDHFTHGKKLVPKRWKDGMEGKVGGETDEWMRHEYFMHYAEGSWLSVLVTSLVVSQLRSTAVPFFIRPITSIVADRIFSSFIFPTVHRHFKLLDENLLAASPSNDGDGYLCDGGSLTAADILVSLGLLMGKKSFDAMGTWQGGSWRKEFPRVSKYLDRIEKEPGLIKANEKMVELAGKPQGANPIPE